MRDVSKLCALNLMSTVERIFSEILTLIMFSGDPRRRNLIYQKNILMNEIYRKISSISFL